MARTHNTLEFDIIADAYKTPDKKKRVPSIHVDIDLLIWIKRPM